MLLCKPNKLHHNSSEVVLPKDRSKQNTLQHIRCVKHNQNKGKTAHNPAPPAHFRIPPPLSVSLGGFPCTLSLLTHNVHLYHPSALDVQGALSAVAIN